MNILLKLVIKIINPHLTIVDSNIGSYYDNTNKVIAIDTLDKYSDQFFCDHVAEIHNFSQVNKHNILTWAILHELGHSFTYDTSDDNFILRQLCSTYLENETDRETIKKIMYLYYNIENEFDATEWAIDFVSTHKILTFILNHLT